MPLQKEMLYIILGGQLQGAGRSVKALDTNTTGSDDLIGTICDAGGTVMIAAGTGNLNGQRNAVKLINEISGQWLAENPG
jgi:hypothetical protein